MDSHFPPLEGAMPIPKRLQAMFNQENKENIESHREEVKLKQQHLKSARRNCLCELCVERRFNYVQTVVADPNNKMQIIDHSNGQMLRIEQPLEDEVEVVQEQPVECFISDFDSDSE
jgi:hypothetical protein